MLRIETPKPSPPYLRALTDRGGGEGEREFMRSDSDTGRQDTSIEEGGEFRV